MPDFPQDPKQSTFDAPIELSKFVVFDTELTGLNPRSGQIISIGAITINCLKIIPHESFYSVVRPEGAMISTATFVHRITPENLVNAPSIEEILPRFVEFCGDSILVGHQLEIDLPFLRKACRKALRSTISNPFVDTLRLARCCKTKIRDIGTTKSVNEISYNLGRLSRLLDLPLFPQHDALGDALQTAYLLLKLIWILKNEGISSCRELCVMGSPSWLQACLLRWGIKNNCPMR
ncbi:MAG: 3'-5' exonuclease [Deltaproteobacteria bacterium]|nr:3'-5' exonuclease [Deltaproteobacteria bacterium]